MNYFLLSARDLCQGGTPYSHSMLINVPLLIGPGVRSGATKAGTSGLSIYVSSHIPSSASPLSTPRRVILFRLV